MYCECLGWARIGRWLTEHHPDCEKYDPEGDAIKIITSLLRGIEAWASDEDGVHPDCWQAYRRAKFCVGEFDQVSQG